MHYQCLMIDDDVTIAENTAEYFNMFDVSTAFVNSFEDAVRYVYASSLDRSALEYRVRNGLDVCEEQMSW